MIFRDLSEDGITHINNPSSLLVSGLDRSKCCEIDSITPQSRAVIHMFLWIRVDMDVVRVSFAPLSPSSMQNKGQHPKITVPSQPSQAMSRPIASI